MIEHSITHASPQILGKLDAPLPTSRHWHPSSHVEHSEMIVVLLDRNTIGGGKEPVVFTALEDILHIIIQTNKGKFPKGGWIVENYLSDSFDDYPNYCRQYGCRMK